MRNEDSRNEQQLETEPKEKHLTFSYKPEIQLEDPVAKEEGYKLASDDLNGLDTIDLDSMEFNRLHHALEKKAYDVPSFKYGIFRALNDLFKSEDKDLINKARKLTDEIFGEYMIFDNSLQSLFAKDSHLLTYDKELSDAFFDSMPTTDSDIEFNTPPTSESTIKEIQIKLKKYKKAVKPYEKDPELEKIKKRRLDLKINDEKTDKNTLRDKEPGDEVFLEVIDILEKSLVLPDDELQLFWQQHGVTTNFIEHNLKLVRNQTDDYEQDFFTELNNGQYNIKEFRNRRKHVVENSSFKDTNLRLFVAMNLAQLKITKTMREHLAKHDFDSYAENRDNSLNQFVADLFDHEIPAELQLPKVTASSFIPTNNYLMAKQNNALSKSKESFYMVYGPEGLANASFMDSSEDYLDNIVSCARHEIWHKLLAQSTINRDSTIPSELTYEEATVELLAIIDSDLNDENINQNRFENSKHLAFTLRTAAKNKYDLDDSEEIEKAWKKDLLSVVGKKNNLYNWMRNYCNDNNNNEGDLSFDQEMFIYSDIEYYKSDEIPNAKDIKINNEKWMIIANNLGFTKREIGALSRARIKAIDNYKYGTAMRKLTLPNQSLSTLLKA